MIDGLTFDKITTSTSYVYAKYQWLLVPKYSACLQYNSWHGCSCLRSRCFGFWSSRLYIDYTDSESIIVVYSRNDFSHLRQNNLIIVCIRASRSSFADHCLTETIVLSLSPFRLFTNLNCSWVVFGFDCSRHPARQHRRSQMCVCVCVRARARASERTMFKGKSALLGVALADRKFAGCQSESAMRDCIRFRIFIIVACRTNRPPPPPPPMASRWAGR
jgi:hypothetical protein